MPRPNCIGKVNLTTKAIDNLEIKDKSYEMLIGEGLYIYVSSTGTKHWRKVYRDSKWMDLGYYSHPALSADQLVDVKRVQYLCSRITELRQIGVNVREDPTFLKELPDAISQRYLDLLTFKDLTGKVPRGRLSAARLQQAQKKKGKSKVNKTPVLEIIQEALETEDRTSITSSTGLTVKQVLDRLEDESLQAEVIPGPLAHSFLQNFAKGGPDNFDLNHEKANLREERGHPREIPDPASNEEGFLAYMHNLLVEGISMKELEEEIPSKMLSKLFEILRSKVTPNSSTTMTPSSPIASPRADEAKIDVPLEDAEHLYESHKFSQTQRLGMLSELIYGCKNAYEEIKSPLHLNTSVIVDIIPVIDKIWNSFKSHFEERHNQ